MSEFPPTVAITGATIWGNRGAEAMLVTTIGEVRRRFPGARIIVASYLPEQDRGLVSDPDITIISSTPLSLVFRHLPSALLAGLFGMLGVRLPDRLLSREIRLLRECDMLLDINGISFSDGREKFLPFNILQIWPATLLGVPVVKLAQAVGPFQHPLNRIAANLFLKRCQHIFARGEITASHLRELAIPGDRWSRAADIAFCYQPEYSLSHENEDLVQALVSDLARLRDDGYALVALTPSSVVHTKSEQAGEPYLETFLELLQDLADEQVAFVVVPNATREGTDTPRNNDLWTIRALQEQAQGSLPPALLERIQWVTYDVNTHAIRRIIEQADVLVTSRFHAMISGLELCKPTFVIGWSHKYEEVLADFGLAEYAVDFRGVGEGTTTRVRALLNNRGEIHHRLREALPRVKACAAAQFDQLEEVLR